MIKITPKCPRCKKSMREPILSDISENNFTQFYISYCPNCIELQDKINAIVWAKTVKGEKFR